jgi:hypothetical protein
MIFEVTTFEQFCCPQLTSTKVNYSYVTLLNGNAINKVMWSVYVLTLYDPQSTMCPLSIAKCDHIITLLNSGTSTHHIHRLTGASTGAISKIPTEYCSELLKSSGGHPRKLTTADINYAKHLIRIRKADNAVQMAKALKDVINQSISSQTIHHNLREFGLWPVVKRKRPLLKARHRRERLQWAERCKKYTMCKGTSVHFLTSPILSHSPPVHMYSPSSPLYYSQGL